ncbi:hypothetical protein NAC44_20985 [Allorhizobium sp. BGMRC 0089]|uniref:hypothetical protein n=1 Tax=Allorhizobium sonneratiae TaxID=2934936 RepID=UPI0020336B33|nr:hypothetical protein [Allorhizobium sonneratiae]MCM2294800.1 hypothetical protein [Allorhizobium sonneratiae]
MSNPEKDSISADDVQGWLAYLKASKIAKTAKIAAQMLGISEITMSRMRREGVHGDYVKRTALAMQAVVSQSHIATLEHQNRKMLAMLKKCAPPEASKSWLSEPDYEMVRNLIDDVERNQPENFVVCDLVDFDGSAE